ncbi:MAG: hypothetical protein U0401_05405 [Anaerolineae bacterium]
MITVEHLQTLSVFAPPPVTRLMLQNPHQQLGGSWRRFHAVTAFADISGFTPWPGLGLRRGAQRGRTDRHSQQVFEALITTVESHGGQVVKFGGDALSLVWPQPAGAPDRNGPPRPARPLLPCGGHGPLCHCLHPSTRPHRAKDEDWPQRRRGTEALYESGEYDPLGICAGQARR